MLSWGVRSESITRVMVSGSDVNDVDFGFNFSTIVNTNDTDQGSLRQFIINANALTDNASLNQAGLTAGAETSVFEIPTTDPNYSASPLSYSVVLANILQAITDPVMLDGSTQPGYPGNSDHPTRRDFCFGWRSKRHHPASRKLDHSRPFHRELPR